MLALIARHHALALRRRAQTRAAQDAAPGTATIMPVVAARCTGCHATEPGFEGFAEAPLGVVLETAEQVEAQAARIHQVTVATPTMPPGNITGMTPEERDLLDRWYQGRSR
jgi:uncharacterized membrane protein